LRKEGAATRSELGQLGVSVPKSPGLAEWLKPGGTVRGSLALRDPVFGAQQFLHMVIAVPQRRAMGLGAPMTPAEINARARDVVELFLHGCRGEV
jgi:hypothetical protein